MLLLFAHVVLVSGGSAFIPTYSNKTYMAPSHRRQRTFLAGLLMKLLWEFNLLPDTAAAYPSYEPWLPYNKPSSPFYQLPPPQQHHPWYPVSGPYTYGPPTHYTYEPTEIPLAIQPEHHFHQHQIVHIHDPLLDDHDIISPSSHFDHDQFAASSNVQYHNTSNATADLDGSASTLQIYFLNASTGNDSEFDANPKKTQPFNNILDILSNPLLGKDDNQTVDVLTSSPNEHDDNVVALPSNVQKRKKLRKSVSRRKSATTAKPKHRYRKPEAHSRKSVKRKPVIILSYDSDEYVDRDRVRPTRRNQARPTRKSNQRYSTRRYRTTQRPHRYSHRPNSAYSDYSYQNSPEKESYEYQDYDDVSEYADHRHRVRVSSSEEYFLARQQATTTATTVTEPQTTTTTEATTTMSSSTTESTSTTSTTESTTSATTSATTTITSTTANSSVAGYGPSHGFENISITVSPNLNYYSHPYWGGHANQNQGFAYVPSGIGRVDYEFSPSRNWYSDQQAASDVVKRVRDIVHYQGYLSNQHN